MRKIGSIHEFLESGAGNTQPALLLVCQFALAQNIGVRVTVDGTRQTAATDSAIPHDQIWYEPSERTLHAAPTTNPRRALD